MYKILPQLPVEFENLKCDSVRAEDIESIRVWRNQQMDVLRQSTPISKQQQIAYFWHHVWPNLKADNPNQILFRLTEDGQLIGYGGLVHVDWLSRRAEISFLLETKKNKPPELLVGYFLKWLKMVQEIAFVDLGLNRLTTETFATRPEMIEALEQSLFKCEGILRSHVNVGGELIDSFLHGRLRADWEKRA